MAKMKLAIVWVVKAGFSEEVAEVSQRRRHWWRRDSWLITGENKKCKSPESSRGMGKASREQNLMLHFDLYSREPWKISLERW